MTADALIAGRERKFARIELKMLGEAGAFSGYASLFGEVDLGKDRVERGAFLKSLARRGAGGVRMLFQHDPAEPIGVWLDLREDVRGLYARGRLIPEVVRARELYALLKAGTADGLSIGFRTVKGRLDPKTRIRKLDAIDLWEISIVTFPLLPEARIRAVKEGGLANPLPPPLAGEGGVGAARVRSLVRHSWPVDPAVQRLTPERLYRRHPRFRFERAGERLAWRDLVLPEKALRY